MLAAAYRHFRTQSLVAAVAIVALVATAVIFEREVLSFYHSYVVGCSSRGDCALEVQQFNVKYHLLLTWLGVVVTVVPGVVGIFWGAPLVARELETGTFRLSWTQSVTRTRWLIVKLALVGAVSAAVALLASLIVQWSASPLDRVNDSLYVNFAQRGVVPMAYALFAFALGVALGVIIRRTLPAMAATLAVFTLVRVAFTIWVRPYLITPIKLNEAFHSTGSGFLIGGTPSPSDWVISDEFLKAGKVVDLGGIVGPGSQNISVGPNGVDIGGVGSCPNLRTRGAGDLVQKCIDQLHLREIVTYQPSSRYWALQSYEALIFVGAAVALGGLALWWVRRRLV